MKLPGIKCEGQFCENDARYIDIFGRWWCSLCDMQRGVTSCRVSDLPVLIECANALTKVGSYDETDRVLVTFKRFLWRR